MKLLFMFSIVSIVATFVLGFFGMVTDDDNDYLFKAFSIAKYFAIIGIIFLITCAIVSNLTI